MILATSAIGTTILGSFLALNSVYCDITQGSSHGTTSHLPSRSRLQHPLIATLSIVIPPMAISITSPTTFLRAIDFAGSYPVLLLFGVIPPVLALRMKKQNPKQTFIKGPTIQYVGLALLSMIMVAMSAIPDMQAIARLVASQFCSILWYSLPLIPIRNPADGILICPIALLLPYSRTSHTVSNDLVTKILWSSDCQIIPCSNCNWGIKKIYYLEASLTYFITTGYHQYSREAIWILTFFKATE